MTTPSVARLRLLARALGYFRPDAGRIGLSMGLLMAGIGINLLKPWPLAVLVDSVLGSRPFPVWLPSQLREWGQPAQITAIIAVSLALHLTHSAVAPDTCTSRSAWDFAACDECATTSSAGSNACRCAITTAPRPGTSSFGPGPYRRLSDPVPARITDRCQRRRHPAVHGDHDGPVEPVSDRRCAGRRAGPPRVAQGLRRGDAHAGDGRPASGEQGLLTHPSGNHRTAADPEPRARASRAAALHRSNRAGAPAEDGAAGPRSLVLVLDLGNSGRVHARRDVGGRAPGPGGEPDPG